MLVTSQDDLIMPLFFSRAPNFSLFDTRHIQLFNFGFSSDYILYFIQPEFILGSSDPTLPWWFACFQVSLIKKGCRVFSSIYVIIFLMTCDDHWSDCYNLLISFILGITHPHCPMIFSVDFSEHVWPCHFTSELAKQKFILKGTQENSYLIRQKC